MFMPPNYVRVFATPEIATLTDIRHFLVNYMNKTHLVDVRSSHIIL